MPFTLEQMGDALLQRRAAVRRARASRPGMPILYENPREVGADRVVNAVAAYEKWKCGAHRGRLRHRHHLRRGHRPRASTWAAPSAPGIAIAMEALFRAASKLPRVEFARPPHVVGAQHRPLHAGGLVFGYVGLVDGICARMAAELGTAPKVVATGGLAPLVAGISKAIAEVDELLTLDGLRIIHERNR